MNHHEPAVRWGLDLLGDLPIWILVGVITYWYVKAARSVDHRHPTTPWPRRYTLCFFTGLAFFTLVTSGPLAHAAMTYISFHMVQHIVLMMLATPLVVMGAPVLLLLRTTESSKRKKWLVPVLRSQIFNFVTNPVVSWLVFAGVLMCIASALSLRIKTNT